MSGMGSAWKVSDSDATVADGGVAPGVIEAGMVSNFESVILYEDDYGKACETSNIDTIVYGEEATRTLSSLPYEPIAIL